MVEANEIQQCIQTNRQTRSTTQLAAAIEDETSAAVTTRASPFPNLPSGPPRPTTSPTHPATSPNDRWAERRHADRRSHAKTTTATTSRSSRHPTCVPMAAAATRPARCASACSPSAGPRTGCPPSAVRPTPRARARRPRVHVLLEDIKNGVDDDLGIDGDLAGAIGNAPYT